MGEISPLPEFSRETLTEAQQAAEAWIAAWCQRSNPAESPLPSVAFGLSCALAELDDTLPQTLNTRKAPLCTGDPDDLILALDAMEGEKIAKVKVGLYEAVRDGMVVNLLLEAVPDLRLRLDANRSWTRTKADGFAKYVAPEHRTGLIFSKSRAKRRKNPCVMRRIPVLLSPGMNLSVNRALR